MPFNKKQTHFTKLALWRLISIFVVGFLTAAAGFTFYFIYQNIYNTIANTNAIVILNSELNISNVDINTFKKVESIMEMKQTAASSTIPNSLKYIFDYEKSPITITTSTSTTTPTKR